MYYRSRNHYILAASDCSRKNVQIVDALEAGALNACDLSFKNTGSQDLLLLNSFDPSQDTPVEALHCLPLGVAKYLIEHLVKITLGGRANEDKMNRLISRLKENECNPSYTKNFRRQLRHVGSFVGRDFKQLIQVLPGIIASEFTDPVNDIKIIQLNRPLQALGKLCSLLFVRQIEAGFEDYVNSIEVSVKELTASLYEFDTVTHNKNAYSTKPKVHYLHHIHQDIRRFGCALQFETEKGEMFNKFIREQLFHTNRLSPSRDVAIRFGSQEILKFIIDGGSWTNKNSKRVRYGSEIKQFVEANESFRSFFFRAREFAENNYENVKGTPKAGFSGVFKNISENTYVVGIITKNGTVKKYEIDAEKYDYGRVLCNETQENLNMNDLIPVGTLDMHQVASDSSRFINTNKFGSILLLKNLNICNALLN
ncbi:hypothetical protein G6F29_005236 [Rhizopus arrhizus]|nr:hypothetical protein G6F29_005236 [Rhizopus arrhizus]